MIRIVRQNTVCFLERFGLFKKVLEPGFHFFIPMIYSVTRPISLADQIINVEHQKVITKDNVELDVNGAFFYRVTDPQKAYYNLENFEEMIQNLSISVSRSEIGRTSLDGIFQSRKELNLRIKEALNLSTVNWGIECLNYEILKLDPPVLIKSSLRDVASAERLKRRDIIISEAERMFQTKQANTDRRSKVIREEGRTEGTDHIMLEFKKALTTINALIENSKQKDLFLKIILAEKYITMIGDIFKKAQIYVLPSNSKLETGNLVFLREMLSKNEALNNPQNVIEASSDKGFSRAEVKEKAKKEKFVKELKNDPMEKLNQQLNKSNIHSYE